MCGFAGCLDLDPDLATLPADAAVRRMTATLAHRGPDDAGLVADGPALLGFRRLAVIDLAGGHQPMPTRDGRGWMVFNGEIYNHAELRADLAAAGERFITASDTEVLLAVCRRSGVHGLNRLRGMFALAYWDGHVRGGRRGRLLLARDRFGIKPLYYVEAGGRLWFASELKALTPLVGGLVDPAALEQYLRFQYVPEPATALAGIRALPAGCWLEATADGRIRSGRWWTPVFRPGSAPAARRGARRGQAMPGRRARTHDHGGPEAAIRAALRDSVRAHLVSDVPVGAFLSGGIDSTSVVALARDSHPALETFSVGFDHPGYSELDMAGRTAAALGVPNVPYVLTMEEFARELPRVIRDLDTPVADPAAVPLWFLAREARRRVKVVLSGEGADELFGGYRIYHQPWPVHAAETLPPAVRAGLARLAASLPDGVRGRGLLERMATPLAERYIGNARIFAEPDLARLARIAAQAPTPDSADDAARIASQTRDGQVRGTPAAVAGARATAAIDVTGPLWAAAHRQGLDDVTAMQFIDVHTWLVGDILVKADRMTMAHGLELRVPFLDREVFRVAATLPRHAKVGKGTTKLALRRAMAGIVPDQVLWRPKLGFPVPIRHWLAGGLYDWAAAVIRDTTAADLLDTTYALGLLRRHRDGAADLSRRVWAVLVFCLWHDQLTRDGSSVRPAAVQLATRFPSRRSS